MDNIMLMFGVACSAIFILDQLKISNLETRREIKELQKKVDSLTKYPGPE